MIAYNANRRNNPNPSVQVPETEAALVELHDHQAAQPRIESARGQSGVPNVRQGQAASPLRTAFTQGAIERQDQFDAHILQNLADDRVRARSRRVAEASL
jgi:hypothetical protein